MPDISPFAYFSGYWQRAIAVQNTLLELIGFLVLGLILYLVLNGYLLSKYGQTIGKKALGIKIAKTRVVKIAH